MSFHFFRPDSWLVAARPQLWTIFGILLRIVISYPALSLALITHVRQFGGLFVSLNKIKYYFVNLHQYDCYYCYYYCFIYGIFQLLESREVTFWFIQMEDLIKCALGFVITFLHRLPHSPHMIWPVSVWISFLFVLFIQNKVHLWWMSMWFCSFHSRRKCRLNAWDIR